jgi:4-hydroxybenzoate polyprenyltransferase
MDPTHLRSAAADYYYVRGLMQVPLGVAFIASALGNAHWGPLDKEGVFLLVLALLAGLSWLASRFYDRHYGRVTPPSGRRAKATAVALIGAAMVIGISLLLSSDASWSLAWPVNSLSAAFGLFMLFYSAVMITLRLHHVVIWGGLVAVSLLPVWHGDDPSNLGLAMCGVAVMVNGVFDHLQIVRTMGPATIPADG